MNSRQHNYGLYALVPAIAVLGALVLGVPAGALVILVIALVCPLMMLFMMSGMHGDAPTVRRDKHGRPPSDTRRG
ncbi:DUF2933 domain-containing protein [Streptomyces sp. A7024]|uniref:DUF2933 domain-containing protein n=1 Tax=Streptomyces coryli TaxID=1128680 RepID=A0A6G4TSH4_9ACTN|nr:DUF2933 domain-containing protein [Streptomyces coryli]NGN62500.1 DUF2933 domain-containing protein [Streptomyces coryli]